ncbi:MAG TPA: metallophosphoesterase [Candidatus Acidoferrum sp.]|nr:metallophosphoesterase [Candidatus Acidoferrum sp.]
MKTIGRKFRAAALIGAAALALALAAGTRAQNQDSNPNEDPHSHNNKWPYAKTKRSPVLAVVGDIACQPGEAEPTGEANHELCINPKPPYTSTSLWQSQEATANQIEAMKPDAVAIAGDLQYQVGQYSDFENSFDLTYGAFKFLHRPAPGNHEFYDEHSQTGVAGYGYFSYYNGFQIDANGNPIATTVQDPCPPDLAAACNYPGKTTPNPQPIPRADGQAGHFELGAYGGVNGSGVGEGWYSYNLGSWHLISLNIECSTQPGGCSNNGSWFASELEWLKKDLDENHSACTAAYWHQPTFSATNGITPEGIAAQAFWQLLYEHRADLVLNGHDHLYAHYRPLDPSGNYDPKNGIREFIVGTGGETLDPVVTTNTTTADPGGNPNFNSLNLETGTEGGFYWGVMALTLDEHGYKWDFESALEAPLAGAPASPNYSDKGFGRCHGGHSWDGNNNNQ